MSSKTSLMATGHDSTKTSIFIDGLFYNLDKIPDVILTDQPRVARAVLRALVLKYPASEIWNYEAPFIKDDD